MLGGIEGKSCGNSEKGGVTVQVCLCSTSFSHNPRQLESSELREVLSLCTSGHMCVLPQGKAATTCAARKKALDISILASLLFLFTLF